MSYTFLLLYKFSLFQIELKPKFYHVLLIFSLLSLSLHLSNMSLFSTLHSVSFYKHTALFVSHSDGLWLSMKELRMTDTPGLFLLFYLVYSFYFC